ncbi:sensor histidine kinase [Pseudogulbenkiania ferrooxidans]|uniref:histidine kinase n=1 Tax=Pseudogulbenkiania ferrooxidans 2002 TaxID=279714 RepID=B9Z3V9_9NEIS|nr:ATP-binding protein [Pseudogulbenkiania ferrooxidans]EEG08536.1 histidine kinase [Pseudogulbenkiania ferrooxidans 2002]
MPPDKTPRDDRDIRGEDALRAEITRLNKVVTALMNRAERGMSTQGSDFGLFQTAVMLEDQVHERTKELEAALHENEKINRALHRAQEQMEREIEQRKEANEALEREKEEQKLLIAQVKQAMNQLVQAEKLASLGSLVAGVAHELNTPLGIGVTVASSLKAMIDPLLAQVAAGTLRKQALLDFLARSGEAVALLENNLQRATNLIGTFKEVAVDQTSMRRRRFDLRQAIDEVLMTLRPKLKHTAHRLDVTVATGITLDSYPGPIEQIISNLVTNTLLHGFEGIDSGTIRIEAKPDQDQVTLAYSDDGIGMNEATAKHAFDPFFTTKLGMGGSGLGLYIVYNLATAVLGGSISVSSAPGQGARFELVLPLTAPVAPSPSER